MKTNEIRQSCTFPVPFFAGDPPALNHHGAEKDQNATRPTVQSRPIDQDLEARADRITRLLSATLGQEEHHDCGVTARPCKDCRRTAPLECIDPGSCGKTALCRPCAATWRCRMWRVNHTRHVRDFHRAIERFPALARLHPDPDIAAAIFRELRHAMRRDLTSYMRHLLATDLPEAVALLTHGGNRL
jgi:hypothetical protein